jgi:DNA polymerase III sliding clamp (beta) subunit (PCNA family)
MPTSKTTSAKPAKNTTKFQSQCSLSISSKALADTLRLLNSAISGNHKGLDRVQIEVREGESIYSVAGDTMGVKITHKARKNQQHEPIQVSCRQLMNLANQLDNSNQKLDISEEKLTVANLNRTYAHDLVTYKDILPQNKSEFVPIAIVKAEQFKQALDKVTPFVNTEAKEVTSGICLQIKQAVEEEAEPHLILTGISNAGMGSSSLTIEAVENEVANSTETDIMVILPKKAISFLASQASGNFALSVASTAVRFSWENIEVTIQTMKGNFPDLEKTKASAENNDVAVKFNRLELLAGLRRHQVMSSEITFKITENNCYLTQATESGSGAENVFCDWEYAEPATLIQHIDYLIKAVSNVGSETVEFRLNMAVDEHGDVSNPIAIYDDHTLYYLVQLESEK